MNANNPVQQTARKVAFPYRDEVAAFEQSVAEFLRTLLNEKNRAFVPVENHHRYKHGLSWRSHPSYKPDNVSELGAHETEMRIPFQDIVDNNLTSMHAMLSRLADAMHATFVKMLFATVNETVEETGNIVDAKASSSQAEAFLEMLRRIEFGVDRNGQPSLPTLHAPPKAAAALLEELSKQGPAFAAEVDRLTAEKIAAATAREAERRARFVRYEG